MSDLISQLQSYGDQLEASVSPVEFDPNKKPDGISRLTIVLALAASVLIIAFLAVTTFQGGDEGLGIINDDGEPAVDNTTETTVSDGQELDPAPNPTPGPTSTEPALPNVVPTFSSFGLSIDDTGNVSIVNSMIDPGGEQMDGVLTVFEGGVEAASYEHLEQPVNQFALANLLFNFPLDPSDGPTREVGLVLEADDGTEKVTLTQDWVMVEGTPFSAIMANHEKAAADNILPRFADLTITTEGNVLSIVALVVDPDDQQLTATVALTENGEQIAFDEQPSAPGTEGSESFSFDLNVPDGSTSDRELDLLLTAISENGTVDFKLTWTMSATDQFSLSFSVDNSGN